MSGWPTVTLGDLTTERPICYGVLKPGERQENGVPLIRITDITSDHLDERDIYLITNDLSNEFKRSILNGGEILLSIQGTIGRVAICPPHLAGANISRTIAVIAPDERIDRCFLRYWLMSQRGNFPITGSTRASLNIGAIRKLNAPIPPLAEQKRIVAILDEAFGAIDRAKRIAETNLSNAIELFESYLNRVFTEKREGWEETALDDLVQIDSPITYGVVKPGSEGDVAFVRGGDLRDGEVLVSQLRTITSEVSEQYKRTLLKGGELLVCLVGVPGQVGIAPPELAEANIARQVGLVRLRDEIDARFVSYFLLSKPGKEGLGGYTGGSVQQVINLRDLKKVKVPLPTDHSEQVQIGKQIHALRNHTRRLQGLSKSKLNAFDELKQSILQKAFTGQLTAKSPELEAVP